jgi:hypothetical protein
MIVRNHHRLLVKSALRKQHYRLVGPGKGAQDKGGRGVVSESSIQHHQEGLVLFFQESLEQLSQGLSEMA